MNDDVSEIQSQQFFCAALPCARLRNFSGGEAAGGNVLSEFPSENKCIRNHAYSLKKSTVKRSPHGTTTDGATLLAKHAAVSMREDDDEMLMACLTLV